YHHDLNDLFVGQLALLLHDRLEQFVGLGIDDLLRLALPVHFIGVEALAGLLAQAVGFVHDVDRSLGLVGHAVGVTLSHDVTTVVAGVHAHYVHQVSRTHGPAELFHALVDALEVGTHADQAGKATEVGEQYAVDQEARAVIDHDRRLAHLLGVGNGSGHGLLAGLLATDHFHQRHHVYRVEEVHADEVFRTLERLGQVGDGDGGGVG